MTREFTCRSRGYAISFLVFVLVKISAKLSTYHPWSFVLGWCLMNKRYNPFIETHKPIPTASAMEISSNSDINEKIISTAARFNTLPCPTGRRSTKTNSELRIKSSCNLEYEYKLNTTILYECNDQENKRRYSINSIFSISLVTYQLLFTRE